MRFDSAETAVLHWLLDYGRSSEPEIESALLSALGLCPRHAWGLAAAEAEAKHGIAYCTAMLHARLLRRAAHLTAGWGMLGSGALRRHLGAGAGCVVCDRLRAGADATTPPLVELPYFSALLEAAAPIAEIACPHCLGGEGLPCRPHLRAGAAPMRGLSRRLGSVADRLTELCDRLVFKAHPFSADEAAAWVESLGWLSGWQFAALVPAGERPDPHGALIA